MSFKQRGDVLNGSEQVNYGHNISWVRYVSVNRAADLTGYSECAIRAKISTGVWAEGKEWKWGADGKQLVDLQGYDRWAELMGRPSMRGRKPSSSTSIEGVR